MSFPQIETELKKVKDKIQEINESIKQLVLQMQLLNITFEDILKPKPKREYKPIEIKLPEKMISNSDGENYIKRYQEKLLKPKKSRYEKLLKKRIELKGKINKKTVNNGRIQ